jgi:isocitrate/isopropylmalate dehydrogenase
VTDVLDDGPRTPDLGGDATTDEVAEAIAAAVRSSAPAHTTR